MHASHKACCQQCTAKNNFSCKWWEEFLEKSAHFSRTVVIPDILSPEKCAEMSLDTLAILGKIFTAQELFAGFRLYVGNAQQGEAWLKQHVFPHPPQPGEDVAHWAARVFGNEKFCIAVNYGERFSDPLATYLGSCLQPLLKKIGVPMDGMEIDILMGNYGYTPFGIHQDRRGENVIHFHLGPGDKIMYNWDKEAYQQLPNASQNNMDIEAFLPHSQAYPFKAGDLYYMPWDKYHIGYTGELSIGVTVWFNNPTRASLYSKMNARLSCHIDMNDVTLTTPEKDAQTLESFTHIEDLLQALPEMSTLTLSELLQQEYTERITAISSNAGWGARRPADESVALMNPAEWKDKAVRVIHPFRITYRLLEARSQLRLFVRGNSTDIAYYPETLQLVEKINAGKPLQAAALMEDFSTVYTPETGAWLLHTLLAKGGIELCEV